MNKRKKFIVPTSAFIVSCRPSSRPQRAHTPSRDPARRKTLDERNRTSLAYSGSFVKQTLEQHLEQILVVKGREYFWKFREKGDKGR